MKLWWHKLRHWEYWSTKIIYLPTFFFWIWNAIKFRSFKFYSFSNPAISNGGLFADSKKDIYHLLPKNLYPRTTCVRKGIPVNLLDIITQNQFQFPVIVKPDIGCRGIGVEMMNNIDELITYDNDSTKNYLIQEMIDFPNELGLFFYRFPNETNGKISGITLKEFLTVEGNGKDTIKEMMCKDARFEMQIPKLANKINLNEILPTGIKKLLVPFGNHSRGTKFLDGKNFISEKLERTFNEILCKIPGFYYGRIDIRYNTFEELEMGYNFSIIEINGAKSEPTHIYDPKHSFWYGQREIFRHQLIFMKIIAINLQRMKELKKNSDAGNSVLL